jgi:hypothetical protein
MAKVISILASGNGFTEAAFGRTEKAGLLAELTEGASAFAAGGDQPTLLNTGEDAFSWLCGPAETGWLLWGFGSFIIQIGNF